MKFFFTALLFRIIPKKAFSALTGILSRIKMPCFLLLPFFSWFCRRYNVNYQEAGEVLAAYPSFDAFFTRRLKPGSRKIDSSQHIFVSPVDGKILCAGEISGNAINVKNHSYTAGELTGQNTKIFDSWKFIVIYLAPGDYHRIHHSRSADIILVNWINGDKFPVHDTAMKSVCGIYTKNTRLVIGYKAETDFTMVCVGAFNVGSISFYHPAQGELFCPPVILPVRAERGGEAAVFHLGSTVVLLMEKIIFNGIIRAGEKIQMGQSLGKIG